MKNKGNILITGGAGYIGSACTQLFCDAGYRVIVFDNLSNSDRVYVDERAIFIEGDILDSQKLGEVFSEYTPEIVIHTAALKSVRESEEQPERYFENNVVGTLNVLTMASKNNTQHFLFSSTASVYRPSTEGLYDEDAHLGPVSVYGNTKMLAEVLINDFVRTKRIPRSTIFRYFNVAGDIGIKFVEKNPQNLFPLILGAIYHKKTLYILGDTHATSDGTGVRDYIHLADVASAHMHAVAGEISGTFNLGTGIGTSVLELVGLFEKSAKESVVYKIAPPRSGDPAVAVAISRKAQTELGWEPKHSIEDIVNSAIRVYKDNE